MADDKSKTNGADRKRVAADQGYEVSYFARKHGLSSKDARTLIQRFGNDRTKLNAEAKKLAENGASGSRRVNTRAGGSNSSDASAGSSRKTRTARTGTVTKAAVLGGVVAASALLWSRRSKVSDQISKLSDQLSRGRQGNGAENKLAAQDTSAETLPLASRSRARRSGRTQVEIAEEALTLKELGRTGSE